MTEQELRAWLDTNGVFSIRLESIAVDGWLFGKYVSREKLIAGAKSEIPIADLALGYDLGGRPMLGWWDDWRGQIGDIVQQVDLESLVMVEEQTTPADKLNA